LDTRFFKKIPWDDDWDNFFMIKLAHMKRTLILVVCLLLSIVQLRSQSSNEIHGNVNSYSGKYVFWHCTPVYEYDIVFVFGATFDIFAFYQNQSGQSEELVKAAFMSSLGKDFDAVLIGNGTKNDVAIKFKDPAVNKALCNPININNTNVFIDAKPTFDYSVIELAGYKRKQTGFSKIKFYTSRNIAENLTIKPVSSVLIIGNGDNHEWIEKK
jgi:hypothetical protein